MSDSNPGDIPNPNDVDRALAAFGAQPIKYRSFGRQQLRPAAAYVHVPAVIDDTVYDPFAPQPEVRSIDETSSGLVLPARAQPREPTLEYAPETATAFAAEPAPTYQQEAYTDRTVLTGPAGELPRYSVVEAYHPAAEVPTSVHVHGAEVHVADVQLAATQPAIHVPAYGVPESTPHPVRTYESYMEEPPRAAPAYVERIIVEPTVVETVRVETARVETARVDLPRIESVRVETVFEAPPPPTPPPAPETRPLARAGAQSNSDDVIYPATPAERTRLRIAPALSAVAVAPPLPPAVTPPFTALPPQSTVPAPEQAPASPAPPRRARQPVLPTLGTQLSARENGRSSDEDVEDMPPRSLAEMFRLLNGRAESAKRVPAPTPADGVSLFRRL